MKAVGSSRVSGTVSAPASKSVMIRAVAASLLAGGTSHLLNPSYCSDSLAALGIVETLGADVHRSVDGTMITGTKGLDDNRFRGDTIRCGESGLCMRMFTPVAGLADRMFTLEASGSLRSRPMSMLTTLQSLGLDCSTQNGYPPVTVRGPFRGGTFALDGSESSQFLTGILLATPLCEQDSSFSVTNLKSGPYIEMTICLLRDFGITVEHDPGLTIFHVPGRQSYISRQYTIEGDWSGASFLLVAGAIAGSITVTGLRPDSFQADRAILEALSLSGAKVTVSEDSVMVKNDRLRAFDFNAENCPDLVPPLAALASNCEGKSTIYGMERLKHKESNRAESIFSEFSRLGINISTAGNIMEIWGGKPAGNIVNSHNDHRIAMACAIVALNSPSPVVIEGFKCVEKSYPRFFEDLDSVRVLS